MVGQHAAARALKHCLFLEQTTLRLNRKGQKMDGSRH
jgi:hypothetical protein